MFVCVSMLGVWGWVPIASALSVVCGTAQPSQPQSWHKALLGKIAVLSQLPPQLSDSLKSGPRDIHMGPETLVGCVTAALGYQWTNADALLLRCRADRLKIIGADLNPFMIHKEPTPNHDFMCDVNYVVCLLYPIISDYIDYMRINQREMKS